MNFSVTTGLAIAPDDFFQHGMGGFVRVLWLQSRLLAVP
jgi:hypothetical protein